jgi:hypothetical protein
MKTPTKTVFAFEETIFIGTERARGLTSSAIVAEQLVKIYRAIVHLPGFYGRVGLIWQPFVSKLAITVNECKYLGQILSLLTGI